MKRYVTFMDWMTFSYDTKTGNLLIDLQIQCRKALQVFGGN